jgi:hypothetical protein
MSLRSQLNRLVWSMDDRAHWCMFALAVAALSVITFILVYIF